MTTRRKSPFPRYTNNYRDRHGKLHSDFRRGSMKVPLPQPFLGTAYWEAYRAALGAYVDGKTGKAPSTIGARRTVPGSCQAAFIAYIGSAEFKHNLAPSTQRVHRNVLRRWCNEWGEHRIAHLRREHFKRWVDEIAERSPSASQVFRKVFRAFMRYCESTSLIKEDPTLGVKGPKVRSTGHHTWTEPEIEQYRQHHALGTQPRLAVELLLNLALRKSDVIRLGRQHMRDGLMSVTQQKTGWSGGIPINAELAAAIVATSAGNLTFLVTEAGAPFTAAGFGNKFRDWRNAAGLPKKCVAHGLRKAACRRLAEAGCTAHEIMAISGHVTLAEVQRYTKAADQVRLARAAMLKAGTSN
jgi:site-specific recombinase XerD